VCATTIVNTASGSEMVLDINTTNELNTKIASIKGELVALNKQQIDSTLPGAAALWPKDIAATPSVVSSWSMVHTYPVYVMFDGTSYKIYKTPQTVVLAEPAQLQKMLSTIQSLNNLINPIGVSSNVPTIGKILPDFGKKISSLADSLLSMLDQHFFVKRLEDDKRTWLYQIPSSVMKDYMMVMNLLDTLSGISKIKQLVQTMVTTSVTQEDVLALKEVFDRNQPTDKKVTQFSIEQATAGSLQSLLIGNLVQAATGYKLLNYFFQVMSSHLLTEWQKFKSPDYDSKIFTTSTTIGDTISKNYQGYLDQMQIAMDQAAELIRAAIIWLVYNGIRNATDEELLGEQSVPMDNLHLIECYNRIVRNPEGVHNNEYRQRISKTASNKGTGVPNEIAKRLEKFTGSYNTKKRKQQQIDISTSKIGIQTEESQEAKEITLSDLLDLEIKHKQDGSILKAGYHTLQNIRAIDAVDWREVFSMMESSSTSDQEKMLSKMLKLQNQLPTPENALEKNRKIYTAQSDGGKVTGVANLSKILAYPFISTAALLNKQYTVRAEFQDHTEAKRIVEELHGRLKVKENLTPLEAKLMQFINSVTMTLEQNYTATQPTLTTTSQRQFLGSVSSVANTASASSSSSSSSRPPQLLSGSSSYSSSSSSFPSSSSSSSSSRPLPPVKALNLTGYVDKSKKIATVSSSLPIPSVVERREISSFVNRSSNIKSSFNMDLLNINSKKKKN
jgi:hypothetical protein